MIQDINPSEPLSDYSSFYDIEINNPNTLVSDIQSYNQESSDNSQFISNKKVIILNKLIFILFIFSISYIIYDNNKIIGKYISQIKTIV